MFKKTLNVLALSVVASALGAWSSPAKTVVVGTASCHPGPPHYAKIQDAVNAVTDGSTVLVCPGLYPEQVKIEKPIILEGIANGTAGAAIITVPADGLVVNGFTDRNGPIMAQLLVQNTSAPAVVIRNIIVDGKGGNCPWDMGATRTIGLQLMNVGGHPAWGRAAGLIQHVVVRNQIDACGFGEGIVSENSYVTIDSNEIHDIDLGGFTQWHGTNDITGNAIQNALGGMVFTGALHTHVLHNILSTPQGVDVDSTSTGLVIAGNTFSNAGILLQGASGNVVRNNRITASPAAITLVDAGGNTIEGNRIFNAETALSLQRSAGGNRFIGNTVNEATTGLFLFQNGTSVDLLAPNTFHNVVTTIVTR